MILQEWQSMEDRFRLQRLALRFEYSTIAWNVGEAALTIGLGIEAASLALLGFGAMKHRVTARLDSAPLHAEARMSILNGALATGTAIGLGLNIECRSGPDVAANQSSVDVINVDAP